MGRGGREQIRTNYSDTYVWRYRDETHILVCYAFLQSTKGFLWDTGRMGSHADIRQVW